MDSRKIVIQETAIMAIGVLACAGLMVGVFAALGYFQMNVLWGALAGSLVTVGNYFFLAVTVSLASDKATEGLVEQAQKMVRLSSVVRLAVMAIVLFVCIKLGANVLALVLPLVFERPVLMLMDFFRKKGD